MSMFSKLRSKFNDKDPLMIQTYIGYASPTSIFIKGRILENEGIFDGENEGLLNNLIDNFKRFESDEVPGAAVKISLKGRTWDLVTDREGYFTLDEDWDYVNEDSANWLEATVEMDGLVEKADLFYASPDAKYGIITDIDDTVLQTHVNSRFKLKMLYATFFQDSHQRLPMEGIVELFGKFSKGSNPIFYISHSPWNIHDLLSDFMDYNNLPKGPIMLRDYGINPVGHFKHHKIESIKRILTNHPELPFIMLGDTAAEDADFYIELAHEFPGQIAAIYIRQTKNDKNARRIKKLVEEHSDHDIDVILSESSVAMMEHARAKGYIS